MISDNERSRCARQLRREPRMKVLLSGEVRFASGPAACRIHDISRGGACLEADQQPRVGGNIEFVRGALAARGTVAWVRGKRFGICFCEPIRATELLIQMSHNRRAMAPVIGPGGAGGPI